jgi:hypothetical protein
MKVRALGLGAAALLALISGCGGRAEPDQAGPGSGGQVAGPGPDIDLDKIDACALLSDDELRAFFGEPPGEKRPNPAPSLRGCEVDDASGTSYVFVAVQTSPVGAEQQFDHDRSQSKKPVDLTGVGEEAFGGYDDDSAAVEARYRGVLVILSLVLYSHIGKMDKLDEPAATFERLTVLTKHALARL